MMINRRAQHPAQDKGANDIGEQVQKDAYQLHRKDAPSTSKEAAAKVAGHLRPLQEMVLRWFRQHGPAISETMEIHFADHHSPNTTRPRISELAALGLLRECGKGITSTGSAARLWEAVPAEELAARDAALKVAQEQAKGDPLAWSIDPASAVQQKLW